MPEQKKKRRKNEISSVVCASILTLVVGVAVPLAGGVVPFAGPVVILLPLRFDPLFSHTIQNSETNQF